MLRSRESERCRYPASRIMVAAGSASVPLFGSATRSMGLSSRATCSAVHNAVPRRMHRGSKVLVDVLERDLAPDHEDLDPVEQLGDLLGKGVVGLVLGGQPDLPGLLE